MSGTPPSSALATPSPAPHELILGILTGTARQRALGIAAELELADLLAEGPLAVDVLASKTNTHAPSLFRLMRALASLAIFEQIAPRVFANSPASELLRKNRPGSMWATIRMGSTIAFEGWRGLMDSIRSGRTAYEEIYGCSIWKFLQRNPDLWAIFNETMRSISVSMTPAVTAAYDWGCFPVIADIGGGIGTQLVDILNAHPGCRGILFDQPDVVAGAIPHDRMERIGGDFFHGVPANADVYVLRMVVHDWAEPEILVILARVREAMKPTSRVVLIEMIVPETPGFNPGVWADLSMLTLSGGRERTAAEYRELCGQAGFELEQIVPTASPHNLLIAKAK
jgi:hypothetical protein